MKLVPLAAYVALLSVSVAACSSSSSDGDKVAVTDEQTQELTIRSLSIAGSLDYGQTSASTSYTPSKKYVAYKFGGNAGDDVEVWVKSKNGDPVAWILDDSGKTVAFNDDASASNTNSHIKVKLPASPSITHYIVVRDYWRDPMSFTVELQGSHDWASGCSVDADCAKVLRTCCSNLGWTAVRAGQETAYHDSLDCADHQICPMIATRPDYSAAECVAGKCQLVQPADIKCGGFVAPAYQHDCPAGYKCIHKPGVNPDLPGSCAQFCGGIAGIACHDDAQSCVDDPSDNCDPAKGGADCGGICQ